MARRIEFDWDDENKKHLAAHKVAPVEFEQLLNNDPIDLNFERALTPFPATVSGRKAFLEKPK